MSPDPPSNTLAIAGFWQRLGAFFLDCLLLGAVGAAAGFFLFDEFVRLGPWGRLVGFCVALAYFGTLNSRFSGGQTLGKRLLKIKVVGKDGSPLPAPKSFLRFLPLSAPWFLNNAQFSVSALLSPWLYILTIAIFGIGLSLVYLYIFNRATRQSLHDIMVGSYVVPAASLGPVDAASTPRVHLGVCVVLVVASGVTPYFTKGLVAREPFMSLLNIQRRVGSEPWVFHASVQKGTSTTSTDQGKDTTTYLNVTAYLPDSDIASPERAKRLATLALSADSSARTLNIVQVTLVYGYDIGIASVWHSHNHARTPAQWLAQ